MQTTKQFYNLTCRQHECLYYLVQGNSAKQIGNILGLSYRTIEYYLNIQKKKFNCKNRQELIRIALKLPMIQTKLLQL